MRIVFKNVTEKHMVVIWVFFETICNQNNLDSRFNLKTLVAEGYLWYF